MSVHQKLFEIQKLGLKFEKKSDNPFFHSKYLSLDDMLNQLLPVLNEYGVLVTHHISPDGHLETHVGTSDPGDTSEFISYFPLPQGDPQKIAAAVTYGKRVNMSAVFNIVADEDDDGNSASKTQREKQAAQLGESMSKVLVPELGDALKTKAQNDLAF